MFYRDPNNRLGYMPVPKNASSTHSAFFQKNGWTREDEFDKHVDLFSHIQDPWKRFKKGMAQLAWINNERNFTAVRKGPFFKMIFFNPHIMPISMQFSEVVDRVHFIPIDSRHSTEELTNHWLREKGVDLEISRNDRKHEANVRKRAYQVETDEYFETHYSYKRYVLELHERDFELWRAAHRYYELPEPKTNWLQKFLKRI